MFPLRILGGPIPRGDKISIEVTPSTTFEAMFPLIQQRLFTSGHITFPEQVSSRLFDLVELEFLEGGKAKPNKIVPLQETPKSIKLQAPALLLKQRPNAVLSLLDQGTRNMMLPEENAIVAAATGASSSPKPQSREQGQKSDEPTANNGASMRFLPSIALSGGYQLPPVLNTPPQPHDSHDMSGSFSPLQTQSFNNTSFSSNGSLLLPSEVRRSGSSQWEGGITKSELTATQLVQARSSRERLSILYGVPIHDYTKMLILDKTLRRAQARGKVDLLMAMAEKALLSQQELMQLRSKEEFQSGAASPLPAISNGGGGAQKSYFVEGGDVAGGEFYVPPGRDDAAEDVPSQSSSPKRMSRFGSIVGSPNSLLKKMRSEGLMKPKDEKPKSILSIVTLNTLLLHTHRECTGAIQTIFQKEHSLTARGANPIISSDIKTFIFESQDLPKAMTQSLLLKLFQFKFMRRDFELFEQQERFRGEKAEFLRFEAVTRQVIAKMFYALWCGMQQGMFLVQERHARHVTVATEEHYARHAVVRQGFATFETAVREGHWEATEARHRQHYILYYVQSLEYVDRRVLMDQYWTRYRLLELERDFSMAKQVMHRIFSKALLGYHDLDRLKLQDLETIYRRQLAAKEWKLRVLLFEMMEQLYRQWLERTILDWLAPVVEKIAAKAIADGRILLALEMKEMRNIRAREEARLRVLMRQNSSVNF